VTRWLLLAAALLAAGAGGWWWWTAPPRSSNEELQHALGLAPSTAHGVVAIAAPRRAARWLARHPQGLLLVGAAAGEAAGSLARLGRFAAPLVAAAQGPLVLWWRGTEAGAAVPVSPSARPALLELAARSSLAASSGPDWWAVATSPELLGPNEGALPPSTPGPPAFALARLGGRFWRVQASRKTLEASTEEVCSLPPETPGTSTLLCAQAGQALAWLGLGQVAVGPVRVAVNDAHQWAVAFPTLHLDGLARSLLGGTPTRAGAVDMWRGVLGTVWVQEGEGMAIASSPELLASLPSAGVAVSEGVVHGGHAAWLLGRVAHTVEHIPTLKAQAPLLARAAELAGGVRVVRLRLEEQRGHVFLAW
jgi:hypothetical protein